MVSSRVDWRILSAPRCPLVPPRKATSRSRLAGERFVPVPAQPDWRILSAQRRPLVSPRKATSRLRLAGERLVLVSSPLDWRSFAARQNSPLGGVEHWRRDCSCRNYARGREALRLLRRIANPSRRLVQGPDDRGRLEKHSNLHHDLRPTSAAHSEKRTGNDRCETGRNLPIVRSRFDPPCEWRPSDPCTQIDPARLELA